MLTIEVTNDGKHPRRSMYGSYDYVVKVNQREVAKGRVENHKRTDRWPSLLAELAKDAERQIMLETATTLGLIGK